MKKVLLMAAMACCLGMTTANATENENVLTVQVQEKTVFEGKWMMKVLDTPMGDTEMQVEFFAKEGEEDKLYMKSEQGEVAGKLKDGKLELEMEAEGMLIDMTIEVVDQDNLKGSVMGMFDLVAKRIKEETAAQ
ncbi:MAG: hypothetical protein HUJ99_06405 [Bacteroidaceae bacterium]|nr:hypothetical protein [Bacteroidaceae bacterium]